MKLLDEILAEERAGAEWAALWQIRIDELEAELRAATARAEAAEADAATCSYYAKRALAAEAKLARVDEYGRYCNLAGVEEAEPPTFAAWQAQQQSKVQP